MVLAACAKEEASIAKIEEVKNPYAVTTDEAVQLLQTVIGGESTRAISVGEIKTLRKSDFVPTTRGADDGDLIYIVDLENGGSAIMGADKRMEPIYAILDETKVSPEQLTLSATRSDDGEQDIEEYVMGLVNAKIGADASVLAFPEMPIVPRPQIITKTVSLGSKAPLLETKWGWGAPYNNMFASSLVCKCMSPIAIAQMFYYFQQPNSLNGYTFDFNLISQCEYGQTPSSLAAAEVSKLVYAIVQYGGYTGGELKFYRGEVTS
ncbi:MAG: Spi family protease inhibitor, partial [Alistipes sp.]|nr:Spi family protease inhibitor [Alistipes sp.]